MTNEKNEFLGEGSYGCTFKPGLDCKGKYNKLKDTVNKITIIDYYSKNEYNISKKVRKIENYKERYSPVIKYCILSYNKIFHNPLINTNNCKNLIKNIDTKTDHYYNSSINKEKFIMFYSKLVPGKSNINKYLLRNIKSQNNNTNNTITYNFNKNILTSLYFLCNSLNILYNNNIVHNDLQNYNNILFNVRTKKPILIDYGLSYYINNLYINPKPELNTKKIIDIKILKKHFFSYKPDNIYYIIEKNFINFFLNNNDYEFDSIVERNNELNTLNIEIIKIFIKNTINSFKEDIQLNIFFSSSEYNFMENSLKKKFFAFANKSKYKHYDTIIEILLKEIFLYNDLFSLTTIFLDIIYTYIDHFNDKINLNFRQNNINYTNEPLIYILVQLLKKCLIVDNTHRLSNYQLINIIEFIIKFINNINLNQYINQNQNQNISSELLEKFNIQFSKLLYDLKIDKNSFTNKNYAYINFEIIFTRENISFIQSLKINFK
jgi:hypothetical protein